MGLTPRALLGKPSIAFDTCSWIWHIPKTRYIDARLALWLHFTPQWKCRKPPSWHEGDAKRAHLKPVEDLLHSEVPLQNPAVPQAPLHVLELEALRSHPGVSDRLYLSAAGRRCRSRQTANQRSSCGQRKLCAVARSSNVRQVE